MISVIARRAPADRQGPDISDPLITAIEVARERGRNEIDSNSTDRELVDGTGPMTDFMQPGRQVEVMDAEHQVWSGRLLRVAFTYKRTKDDVSALVHTEIERQV